MGDVSLGKSAYLGEAVVPQGLALGRIQWLAKYFFKNFEEVGLAVFWLSANPWNRIRMAIFH